MAAPPEVDDATSTTMGVAQRPAPLVFISYARADGAGLAGHLRRSLQDAGVAAWHDLSDLAGGQAWWSEIRLALGRVHHLVLVVTDAALRSEQVRRECEQARRVGVPICPVHNGPPAPGATVPHWLARLHWLDVSPASGWLDALVDQLRRPAPRRRVPFMAEDLPVDFVVRPEALEALVGQLVNADRLAPVAITAALRGAGGYGKTTLARAICHDPRVQDAFADGVLWVTLGESPTTGDLIERAADLVATLDGTRPAVGTLDAARAALQDALVERELLLVIDDVWDAAHLAPFLSGGAHCARLVTTRNRDTLPPDSAEVPLDQMRQAEAVQLLGCGLPPMPHARLHRMSAQLCEWPLLLKLANGMLRRRLLQAREPAAATLDWMEQALQQRGITAFDARNATERDRAIARTLGLSLDQLAPDEVPCFFDLAVFAEDLDVPLHAVRRMWQVRAGLDDWQADDLLLRLQALSLLQRLDLAAGTLRLHDAIRRYAIDVQAPEALRARHGAVVDALATGRPPHRAAVQDAYLLRYLSLHLASAGRADDLARAVCAPAYGAARIAGQRCWSLQDDLRRALDLGPPAGLATILRQVQRELARCAPVLDRITDGTALRQTLHARLAPWLAPHALVSAGLASAETDDDRHPCLLALTPLPALHADLQLRISPEPDPAFRCMAFAPDGRTVLVGTAAARPIHWPAGKPEGAHAGSYDTDTGRPRARFSGHRASVNACAASPDGRWAVSVGDDGRLDTWDLADGTALSALNGIEQRLLCCAVHPDGGHIAVGCGDDRVRVWSLASGHVTTTLHGHAAAVVACAFSPCGRWLASGGADGHWVLWSLADCSVRLRAVGHPMAITGLCFADGGRTLATSGADGLLQLWDLDSGTCRRTLRGHRGAARACAAPPTGPWLLSAGDDGLVQLWRTDRDSPLRTLPGDGRALRALALPPDGERFATLTHDGELLLWDLQLDEAAGGGARNDTGLALVAAVDGRCVITRDTEQRLAVWQGPAAKPVLLLAEAPGLAEALGGRTPLQIRLAPDEQTLLAWRPAIRLGGQPDLWLWRLDTGEPLPVARRPGDMACVAAFDPVGGGVLTLDNHDRLCELALAAPDSGAAPPVAQGQAQLSPPPQELADLVLDPSGTWLAMLDAGGELSLYERPTGRLRLTSRGHADPPLRGDDGSWALATDGDPARLLHRHIALPGHRAPVACCAFNADGSMLLTGDDAGVVLQWDLSKGRSRPAGRPHRQAVSACGFTGLGNGWYSAGWDGRLQTATHACAAGTDTPWTGRALLDATTTDGGHWLAATSDGRLLHRGPDRELPRTLAVRGGAHAVCALTACALTPNATVALAGTSDGQLFAVTVRDGGPRWSCAAHSAAINRCVVSPDGARVCTVADDGQAAVWATQDGRCLLRLAVGDRPVVDTAWSPDGRLLALVDWRHGLTVRDSQDGTLRAALPATPVWHAGVRLPLACDWSKDGRHMAVAQGCGVSILSWPGLVPEQALPGAVRVMVRHGAGTSAMLAIDGWHGVLSARQLHGLRDVTLQEDRWRAVVSADRADLAAWLRCPSDAPSDDVLPITTARGLLAGWPLDDSFGPVCAASLANGGRYLALAFGDGALRIADLVGGGWAASLHTGDTLRGVAWLNNGSRLVASGALGLYWLAWRTPGARP